MYRIALCIALILGVAGDSLAMPSPQEEVELAAYQLPVEVDLPVIWKDCGSWNGMYDSSSITLCTDNLRYGIGVATEIYLHELGHGYTFSRHIPFDRWKGNTEAAADEFAAVMCILQGHPEYLLRKASLWLANPGGGGPWDPHPSNEARAMMFLHIYWGYIAPQGKWGDTWRDTLAFWGRMFLEHP